MLYILPALFGAKILCPFVGFFLFLLDGQLLVKLAHFLRAPDIARAIPVRGVIVLFGLLAAVTPTTKTMIAMFGLPALVQGAKDVATSEIGQKSYAAVSKLLDTYLADKPESSK